MVASLLPIIETGDLWGFIFETATVFEIYRIQVKDNN